MKNFTKSIFAIALFAIAMPGIICAQSVERPFGTTGTRQEIIFPKVNGLNVYKADFTFTPSTRMEMLRPMLV